MTLKNTDCGDPTPENGAANITSGTMLGQETTVSCDEGYNLNGADVITCHADGWSETPICTIQGLNISIINNNWCKYERHESAGSFPVYI